jgi:hypothetical protein
MPLGKNLRYLQLSKLSILAREIEFLAPGRHFVVLEAILNPSLLLLFPARFVRGFNTLQANYVFLTS